MSQTPSEDGAAVAGAAAAALDAAAAPSAAASAGAATVGNGSAAAAAAAAKADCGGDGGGCKGRDICYFVRRTRPLPALYQAEYYLQDLKICKRTKHPAIS